MELPKSLKTDFLNVGVYAIAYFANARVHCSMLFMQEIPIGDPI